MQCVKRVAERVTHFDLENILTGANQDVRDHSGKKARQYLASQEAAVSQDTFRSKYIPKREDIPSLEKKKNVIINPEKNLQTSRACRRITFVDVMRSGCS